MGRIYFRQFYTTFVEFCFCAIVRQWKQTPITDSWHKSTKYWLDNNLSEEDKLFIRFVFDEKFYNTTEGLACFEPSEDYDVKRKRLYDIERRFAIDCGLIDDSIAESQR